MTPYLTLADEIHRLPERYPVVHRAVEGFPLGPRNRKKVRPKRLLLIVGDLLERETMLLDKRFDPVGRQFLKAVPKKGGLLRNNETTKTTKTKRAQAR